MENMLEILIVMLAFSITGCDITEPKCLCPFNYEDTLVYKLIKMEEEVKHIRSVIDELKSTQKQAENEQKQKLEDNLTKFSNDVDRELLELPNIRNEMEELLDKFRNSSETHLQEATEKGENVLRQMKEALNNMTVKRGKSSKKTPVPSDWPDAMKCPSGKCAAICDHTIEAKDRQPLDEQDCMTCTNQLNYGCRCDPTKGGTCDFKCIPMAKRCDGFPDCPLGDDETDCPDIPCHKGQVCCLSGECAHVCDGQVECMADNADENLCEPPVPSECPGMMECPSGECATVCNHDIECNDEAEDCEPLDEQDCRHVCPELDVVCSMGGGCGEFCEEGVQCPNGYDESMCYLECADDEVSCELENSPRDGCVELCDGTEDCEGPGWDEDDIYCGGSCLSCGIPGMCTKTDSCT